jgi:DNA-binding CsgD family transcriptional regulator
MRRLSSLSPDLAERFASLAAREHETAVLIITGHNRVRCAAALGCTVKTYDTHRLGVLAKTGARSNVDLMRMAIACGFASMHDDFTQEDIDEQ